ncbi:hypothetical protein BGZ76_011150 [Entomortierella beljakovae]|nr:hypothetical protein BGZ76_011150 [Entomortierella beljakovae]
MGLFKSNKNKSASAASTPAQTPRSSVQVSRPPVNASPMTQAEAMKIVMKNSAPFGCNSRSIICAVSEEKVIQDLNLTHGR